VPWNQAVWDGKEQAQSVEEEEEDKGEVKEEAKED